MKAVYKKPVIHIELFTLSQAIADGCNAVIGGNSLGFPNSSVKGVCGWVVGSEVYWSTTPGCDDGSGEVYPQGWDELEGVCYNNPNGGNTIFNS